MNSSLNGFVKLEGETMNEIFRIQLIESTQVLMTWPDPFDGFQYDSSDVNCLPDNVYLKTSHDD